MKGGALAKLAGMWCNDSTFQTWLRNKYSAVWARHDIAANGVLPVNILTGNMLRELLSVKTRAELDHDADAGGRFNHLIRWPYADHLRGKA